VLAVLAIAAEFLGGIGLLVGFLGRVAAFASPPTWWSPCYLNPSGKSVSLPTGLATQKGGRLTKYHILAFCHLALANMIKGSGALSIDRSASRQLA